MAFRCSSLLVILLLSCSAIAQQDKSGADLLDHDVRVDIRQGTFYLLDEALLVVRDFHATLVPAENHGSDLVIRSGEVFLSSQTLTQVMNQQMAGQQLKNLQFSTTGQKVKIEGTMQKVLPIPFNLTGQIKTTADGKIVVDPTSVEAAGIPIGDVMDLFNVKVEDVTGNVDQRAISLQGDTLLLSPGKLSRKLHLRGEVRSVEVQKEGLLLIFGPARPTQQSQGSLLPPTSTAKSSSDPPPLPQTASPLLLFLLAGAAATSLGVSLRR